MLKATWRRLGSSTWLSIGLVFLLPALAEAQLFPNRTIRRERPSPVQEAPFNAQVRREFYGYYPTCWSKFPEGWKCPCPSPDELTFEASKIKNPLGQRKRSLESIPELDDMGNPANDRGPAPGAGDNPEVPLPPPRSPFDIQNDTKPPTNRTPAPAPPLPGNPDPFITDPAIPKPPPVNRTPPPTGLMEMPSLPAVSPTADVESSLQPGSMELVPDATLASNAGTARPDLGPLPSAPTPAPFVPSNASTVVNVEPIANMPAPAQAPRRRSLIGSLFGRNNNNTTNR